VGWVTKDALGDWELHLVKSDMTNYVLAGSYKHSPYPSFLPINTTTANSAAVGLASSGFYTTDTIKLKDDFDDGYVEFASVQSGVGVVPYLPRNFFSGWQLATGSQCPGPGQTANIVPIPNYDFGPRYRFAWMWFANRGIANHIWLAGTAAPAQLNNCVTCVQGQRSNPTPQSFGSAQAAQAIAYVYHGGIQDTCPGSAAAELIAVQNTNDHETGHLFQRGHDNLCEWPFDGPRACSVSATQCANPASNGCQMK